MLSDDRGGGGGCNHGVADPVPDAGIPAAIPDKRSSSRSLGKPLLLPARAPQPHLCLLRPPPSSQDPPVPWQEFSGTLDELRETKLQVPLGLFLSSSFFCLVAYYETVLTPTTHPFLTFFAHILVVIMEMLSSPALPQ